MVSSLHTDSWLYKWLYNVVATTHQLIFIKNDWHSLISRCYFLLLFVYFIFINRCMCFNRNIINYTMTTTTMIKKNTENTNLNIINKTKTKWKQNQNKEHINKKTVHSWQQNCESHEIACQREHDTHLLFYQDKSRHM